MAARPCPYCRSLNSADEKRCHRCGRRLPGPVFGAAFDLARDALGVEAPMTRLIIGIELAVFGFCLITDLAIIVPKLAHLQFFELLFGGFRRSTLIRFGALGGRPGEFEPWRLLSAVFVHASFFHILMNLFTFASIGRQLEGALGGARLVLLFVLSGLLGFVASEIWYGPFGPLTVGASGAVFGGIGAFVGILYARRDPEWKRALVRYLILAGLLGLAMPVNTAAHLGGFFAGILLGFALYREQGRLRLHRLAAVLAGISLLASVASVVLSARSMIWRSERAAETQRR